MGSAIVSEGQQALRVGMGEGPLPGVSGQRTDQGRTNGTRGHRGGGLRWRAAMGRWEWGAQARSEGTEAEESQERVALGPGGAWRWPSGWWPRKERLLLGRGPPGPFGAG